MRVSIVGRLQPQSSRISVHFLHEILNWLVLTHSSLRVNIPIWLASLALSLVLLLVSVSISLLVLVLVIVLVLLLRLPISILLLLLLKLLLLIVLVSRCHLEQILSKMLS